METPHAGGDWSRILGRTYQDHSAFSVYGTLGKRSVAVDLKTPEGKEILWRLTLGADVFMEGFRPGTMKRYGFDYEAVRAKVPAILYYSISGFGQTGPLASRPAMDPVLQAFIGIVNENRGDRDNHPHRIAISLIDMFTGLLGFQAISTSLHVQARQKVKQGRYLEASLMQGGAMLSVIRMIAQYLERGQATRTSMPNGVFDTADGQLERHDGAANRLAAVLRSDRAFGSVGRPAFRHSRRARHRIWTNSTRSCGRCSKRSQPNGWRNGSPNATS